MCIIYTIYYAYSNKELAINTTNECNGKYIGDNIRYNKNLDKNSRENYLMYIHSMSRVGSYSTTSDSSISDYSLKDP